MIMANPRFLFVYGTLMSTASGVMGRSQRARLAKSSRMVGRAAVSGQLFDLGGYPGLVLELSSATGKAGGSVFGELRELAEPGEVFDWLDHYEGIGAGAAPTAGYRRKVLRVTHLDDDGREIASPAWVYVYEGALAGARLLAGGAWPA
jgi:gamma-glutamylcyclotransferase (GGCT)/AIG2-like uncharacterized protein YtfP